MKMSSQPCFPSLEGNLLVNHWRDNGRLINEHLSRAKTHLSAFSLVSIYLWQGYFQFSFETINGCLCVFARNHLGCFLYLPPVGGEFTEQTAEECFRIMDGENRSDGYSRIENVPHQMMPFFNPNRYHAESRSDEYIYYREDIASFQGTPFKSQRWAVNNLMQRHRPVFVPFSQDMAEECLALYDRWAKRKLMLPFDDIYKEMVRENRSVHTLAFRGFHDLPLNGRVVMVDGRIKAYTFGYPLHEGMFCVLLEITDPEVKGLSAYTFHEFCRDEATRFYKFINAMDDFAMDNIARTKKAYKPVMMVPSYTITKKRGG
jgi:uncharacterized protein